MSYMYGRRKASDLLERIPQAWRTAQILRHINHPFVRRIATSQHDILIEGYPRCANSFTVKAFLFDNGWRDVRVTTHTHNPTQIILAAQWNIPSMVLIRSPDEAVPSTLALGDKAATCRPDSMSAKQKLQRVRYLTSRYYNFYDLIQPYRHQFTLASFSEIISDFGMVMRQLNKKFSCAFQEFSHTAANINRIFKNSNPHLSPTNERTQLKNDFEAGYFSVANEGRREHARQIFFRLTSSEQQTATVSS